MVDANKTKILANTESIQPTMWQPDDRAIRVVQVLRKFILQCLIAKVRIQAQNQSGKCVRQEIISNVALASSTPDDSRRDYSKATSSQRFSIISKPDIFATRLEKSRVRKHVFKTHSRCPLDPESNERYSPTKDISTTDNRNDQILEGEAPWIRDLHTQNSTTKCLPPLAATWYQMSSRCLKNTLWRSYRADLSDFYSSLQLE